MGYYDKVTNNNSIYSSTTGDTSTEPNMRSELSNMFDGVFPEVAKKRICLLRTVRLNSSNNPTKCECTDRVSGEPDRNIWCPFCFGLGYYTDESLVEVYASISATPDSGNTLLDKMYPPGILNIPTTIFYLEYQYSITTYDKILFIQLDKAGNVVYPVNRIEQYTIARAWEYRCDNGKSEYWKLFCHKDDMKYLNTPSYQGESV